MSGPPSRRCCPTSRAAFGVQTTVACSMASFGSSVQVRPGATFQRTMGPCTSLDVRHCVRDHRCWHKGRFHAARPVSFTIFFELSGLGGRHCAAGRRWVSRPDSRWPRDVKAETGRRRVRQWLSTKAGRPCWRAASSGSRCSKTTGAAKVRMTDRCALSSTAGNAQRTHRPSWASFASSGIRITRSNGSAM
jgi:hypothetical protein